MRQSKKLTACLAAGMLMPAGVAPVYAAPQPAAARVEPDDAARFGARSSVTDVTLSPDGSRVAFLAPGPGSGVVLYTVGTGQGDAPAVALRSGGDADQIRACKWVSNVRLACTVISRRMSAELILAASSTIAIDADGKNQKLLSRRMGSDAIYWDGNGGDIVDYLPDADATVLMARTYVPESRVGSLMSQRAAGLGVDRLDTRTLAVERVEPARRDAEEYITDGHGTVRIMGMRRMANTGYQLPMIQYLYRSKTDREWRPLSLSHTLTHEGFNPYAVDRDKDVAYGFKQKDGRQALYSVALDGSMRETLLFAHPAVDVDGLLRIGTAQRVVGAGYATDKREAVYFDPELARLTKSLAGALPKGSSLRFVDASRDEQVLLLWAGSDVDPGRYYRYDRRNRHLDELLVSRPELGGVPLAPMKMVTVRTADGVDVPAYLTLPVGTSGRGLPAIVMPHGGPGARDEWGFDWLVQYYARRGYAVLQPNYRGSTGYGDTWFQQNGFKSWSLAIGDVAASGRWLVSQGIADPAKLAIVGWSYGGYAALQAAATQPDLFKAVVAIAPVTDLGMLKEAARSFSNFAIIREYIGEGPHVRDGSPLYRAAAIKAPVMLFHGDLDQNVKIEQSTAMAGRLKSAGARYAFVRYEGADHYIEDGKQRADLLRRSDAFLKTSLGL